MMSTTLTRLDLDQLSIDTMSHRRNRASQFGPSRDTHGHVHRRCSTCFHSLYLAGLAGAQEKSDGNRCTFNNGRAAKCHSRRLFERGSNGCLTIRQPAFGRRGKPTAEHIQSLNRRSEGPPKEFGDTRRSEFNSLERKLLKSEPLSSR